MEKKSSISSISVGLSAQSEPSHVESPREVLQEHQNASASKKAALPVFSILICSDLGADWAIPVPLSSATLTTDIESLGGVIRGTVTADTESFFVEIPLLALLDSSSGMLRDALLNTTDQGKSLAIIEHYRAKKISRNKATQELKDLGYSLPDLTNERTGSSRISSILDMVDVPNALATATADIDITNTWELELDKVEKQCSLILVEKLTALRNAPFIEQVRTTLAGIKRLAKTVGRNGVLEISLISVEQQECSNALRALFATEFTTDCIIYDYPVLLTKAALDAFGEVCALAHDNHALAIGSLDDAEPVISDLSRFDHARPIFTSAYTIALSRLRKETSARCGVLAGPSCTLTALSGEPVRMSAGLVMAEWIARCLKNGVDLFEMRIPHPAFSGSDALEPQPITTILQDLAEEAATFGGLCIFPAHRGSIRMSRIPTLIDSDSAAPMYGHMGANLIINRAIRASMAALAGDEDTLCTRIARALADVASLMNCPIPTEGITVDRTQDNTVLVEVHTDIILSNQPFEFSFSLGI